VCYSVATPSPSCEENCRPDAVPISREPAAELHLRCYTYVRAPGSAATALRDRRTMIIQSAGMVATAATASARAVQPYTSGFEYLQPPWAIVDSEPKW